MKLAIATDYTIGTLNGKYYLESQMSTICERYYNAFGKFTIITRVQNLKKSNRNLIDVTDFIEKTIAINKLYQVIIGKYDHKLYDAINDCDLIVLRCPSIIAQRVGSLAHRNGIKTYAECMGCAWDAYWNHSLTGKIIAPYMYLGMKKVVRHSDYALYVTEQFLQRRYPCKGKTISASNVKIDPVEEEVFEKRIENNQHFSSKTIKLMTAAAVDVRYKGQEYVIKALKKLRENGLNVTYYLAGGGDQTYLRTIADKYDVSDNVVFLGRLLPDEVKTKLDEVDIYVQPSLQEGLPRSVIEAMSRGCVCAGAKTAGIPELICKDYVFKRKSVKGIVDVILKIMNNKNINSESRRNFERAKNYISAILDERRNQFYTEIKKEISR